MKLYTEDIIKKIIADSSSLDDFMNQLDETETNFELEALDIEKGQAAILMFPIEYGEVVAELAPLLQKIYPDNPVVALVDDVDILIQNPDQAISLLDSIKAKISILKDTDDTSKIII